MWQIGAEGGMWDRPVRMSRLVLTPAERADVIVDFRGLEGQTLIVHNSTPAAPVSTPAPPLPTVMQIRVGTTVTHRGPRDIPNHLPGLRADLPRPDVTRFITLNEIAPEGS
jgi:spore coat protein A